MADKPIVDKPIGDLTPATAFTQSDLLVMEQGGVAKSVTGQVLMKDLAKMLDGHGGINNIALKSSEGLVDTYEITTADGTKFEYAVTNGFTPRISLGESLHLDGRPGVQIQVEGQDGTQKAEIYDGKRGPSGTPRNWLDNSNFRNIVNQRGQHRYSGIENNGCVDRWNLVSSSTMLVQGTHVICTGTFYQEFSDSVKDALNGKTVTVAIRDNEGNLYVASGNFTTGFRAENRGVRIVLDYNKLEITVPESSMYDPQIALYIGDYTEEDVPEYQPKGYAAELLECQRYYRRYPASNILAMGYTDAEGKVLFSIPVSTGFKSEPVASELTGAKIIVDGDVITITDKVIPKVTSRDFNAVHFSLGDDFVLSDKPNKMVAISNVTAFELSAEQ